MQYLFEFGILIGKLGEGEFETEHTSKCVVDITEVCQFWEVKDHEGPFEKVFPSVTTIMLRSGESTLTYYSYKDFKELYQSANNVTIVTKPYVE